MALIYRCDRCGKDFRSGDDLIHIAVGADHRSGEYRSGLQRSDVRIPFEQDFCKECTVYLLLAAKPLAKEAKP